VFPFHHDETDKVMSDKLSGDITTQSKSSKLSHQGRPPDDPFFSEYIQPGTIPLNTHIPRSKASTTALEKELHWTAYNYPSLTAIKSILTILVQERKIKPSSHHYEALILANCSPEEGSAENVNNILAEMEEEGVEISGNVYTAALLVSRHHDIHTKVN
jgi:hypothetical protein